MKNTLKMKAKLNFALSLITKGGKNATFFYPVLKAVIVIRNHSLTSEDFNQKKQFVVT